MPAFEHEAVAGRRGEGSGAVGRRWQHTGRQHTARQYTAGQGHWARRAGVTARRLPAPGAPHPPGARLAGGHPPSAQAGPDAPGPGASRVPTLVLLAGAGLGSAFWEPVLTHLPGWHVLIDRQGRLGTRCSGLPSLDVQAAVLARLLEDLGVADGAPTILVAHSMAAFEAELLARRRPDLVDGIVLVDPSLALRPALVPPLAVGAVGGRAPLAGLALGAVRLLLAVPAAHRVVATLVRAGMRRQVSRPQALDAPAWADTWSARALTGGAAESLAYSAQQEDLLRVRSQDRLAVQVPTVLLQAPPYASRRRLAAAEQAFGRLVVRRVPRSGHLMAQDAPRQVARAVLEVLDLVLR